MFSYLKEAFFIRTRTSLFGDVPINLVACVAFLVMGAVANPGFWFAGLALEAVFLAAVATSSTFHRFVRGKQLLEQEAEEQGQIRNIEAKLSKPRLARLAAIRERGNQVLDTIKRLDSQALDVHVYQLPVQNAVATASKLLLVQEMFEQALASANETALLREIAATERSLKDGALPKENQDALQDRIRTLNTRLAMHHRRNDQLTRSENDLMRIENGLEKMLDEVLIAKKPTGLDEMEVDFGTYSVDTPGAPEILNPNALPKNESERENA